MKQLYKYKKGIAVFLFVVFLSEMVCPTVALALTGGPSQPEVQSFEPENTTQIVEPFTGDFVYNLPLMKVGDYPINISYHSGITMEQEASWVGLGWNINPGAITRNMRALPDDFSGDAITKEFNIKKDWTAGVNLSSNIEFVGLGIGGGTNMGIFYNNYKGVGFEGGTSFSFSYTFKGAKGSNTSGLGMSLSLGLNFNSQSGIDVSPSCGLSVEASKGTTVGANMGLNYNSRAGLTQLTIGGGANTWAVHSRLTNTSTTISFANPAVTPTISFPMENFGFSAKLKIGGTLPLSSGDMHITGDISGSYSQQKLAYKSESLAGYGYLYMDQSGMDPHALLDFNREKDQPFRKPSKKSGDEGTPLMAIPNYTYDLFSVSGQGVGGQYRAARGDIGSVYDHATNTRSGSGSVNLDVGLGGFATIGVDISVNVVNTRTSNWISSNELAGDLIFYGNDNTLYEPAAFINS